MSFRFFPRLAFLLVLCAFVSCSGKEGKESAKPAAVSPSPVSEALKKPVRGKVFYLANGAIGDTVYVSFDGVLPSGYSKRRWALSSNNDTIFIPDVVPPSPGLRRVDKSEDRTDFGKLYKFERPKK